jgi:hypothetical protein
MPGASSSREQKSREKPSAEAILLARDRATEWEMRALGALLVRTDEPLAGMDGNEPGDARTKSIPRRGAALTRGTNRQAAPMRKNENRRAREEIQDQDTQRMQDLLQIEEKWCESEPENLFGEKRIWSTEEEIEPAVWSDQHALALKTAKLENQQRKGSRGNEINNRTQRRVQAAETRT